MICRPPRSTLFPYTNALPIYADLLLLAGRLVLGRDLHDAVGVDVESDLDLRHSARRRRNSDQIELDRKSTRLNSSHLGISYAVFCLKKKKKNNNNHYNILRRL